jgi:hypothetical protein
VFGDCFWVIADQEHFGLEEQKTKQSELKVTMLSDGEWERLDFQKMIENDKSKNCADFRI